MTRDLRRLLAPSNVAVIAGRYAEAAVAQLERIGFSGDVEVVSRSRHEVAGHRTVRSVAELEDATDCALLAIPAEACVEAVATLRAKGCGGAVVFSSEFAEVGRADLQAALVEAARGMPLLGPNCHGFVNGLDAVALWPDEHGVGPVEEGVAILSQSGNIALNLSMQRRSLPIALLVSLGNQAQLDATDFLRWCATDARITAVGLHLEGIADPPAFARAVVDLGKPIVVLKTGRSEAAARAALTHTRTLAGSDCAYDALFRRCGIGRVATPAELLETLKLLHVHGRVGRRIASLSCSGGEAGLVADLAERHGLVLPPLPPATEKAVAEALEGRVRPANPLDYHTFHWGDVASLTPTFAAMLAHPGIDLGMLVLDFPTTERSDPILWSRTMRAFVDAAAATGRKAVVVASLPECFPQEERDELMERREVAALQGLGEAIAAIAAASVPEPTRLAPMLSPPLRSEARCILTEVAAKRALREAGVTVPEGRFVQADKAAEAAAELGFPVVVKAGNGTAHKTEAGGVALNLRDAAAVEAAVGRMAGLGPRFLVERMVEGAVCELIVGVTHEPGFGPVLTLGAGGVLAELLGDTATLLLPTSAEEARDALMELRVGALLRGWRGGPKGDVDAAVWAVLAIAGYAQAHADRLVELDVNPLLVLAEGKGAVVVDALMVTARSARS